MIRINLLPHRQERRRERQRQMVTLLGMVAGFSMLTVVLGHTLLSARLDNQQERNKFLRNEIKQLDQQIDEIKRVKEETSALLSRKQVVEQLQSNRSEAVHVLDQLLRVMPEGAYLKSIRQNGANVNLAGYAQSNARVSSLLHNLNESPWLESAELVEIHSAQVNDVRAAEFNINVKIRRVLPGTPDKPATAGAKPVSGSGSALVPTSATTTVPAANGAAPAAGGVPPAMSAPVPAQPTPGAPSAGAIQGKGATAPAAATTTGDKR